MRCPRPQGEGDANSHHTEALMPNHHRGEIECRIGDRRLSLCLTLGALAEIESALGADGLAALGERLSGGRLATRDLLAILGAAARGAGERIDDDEMRAMTVAKNLPAMIEAVVRLLRFAFDPEDSSPRP